MARGTDFGGIHSHRHLHLIQQQVDEQPAEPKLNMIDIPGADGSKDMSELPGGRLTYKDRTITWLFALYPGENWDAKHRQVSNALNGKRCRITLDTNPGYYYDGRVVVKKYNKDKALRQITVEAICSPYLLKQEQTVKTLTASNANTYEMHLPNDRKPAIPVIKLTHDASFIWNQKTLNVSAGTYTSLDIELKQGDNVLFVKFPGGTGTITITYQEGSL